MEIQKPVNRFLQCIVTCCYAGYIPFAPGTWASVLGCLMIYFFPFPAGSPFFAVGLVLFAVLSVNLFQYEGKDPGYIVIDELAGICVTMAGHRITFTNMVIGFVCFRFFDIVKPYPIRLVEGLKGGYGVVADDVLAGVFSSVVLFIAGAFL